MKKHRFILIVTTTSTRQSAELAVLSAFAIRKPDGHSFHLNKTKPPAARREAGE